MRWDDFNSPLIQFGVLLLWGLVGGEVAQRLLRLPRIFGYVLSGLLVGVVRTSPEEPLLQDARVFVDVALGLIVFDLGRRVDFRWMLKERWLLWGSAAESALTFGALFGVLKLSGITGLTGAWAAVAAAIGIATSPPVVMVVIDDLKAEGQITERTLLHTWLNCAVASVLVAVLTLAVHLEHGANWQQVALHPLYLLAGSGVLAALAAVVLLRLATWGGKREAYQFVLLVGAIVLTVGVARQLKLPVLLVLLVFGALARNLDKKHVLRSVDFGAAPRLFVVVLFVLTGASLHLRYLGVAAVPAVAYVVARFFAKWLGVMLPSSMSGIPAKRAGLLALALQPLSATAVVLALDTAQLYPQDANPLTAVVLSAVALMELVGPLAVQLALKRANEVHPEPPVA